MIASYGSKICIWPWTTIDSEDPWLLSMVKCFIPPLWVNFLSFIDSTHSIYLCRGGVKFSLFWLANLTWLDLVTWLTDLLRFGNSDLGGSMSISISIPRTGHVYGNLRRFWSLSGSTKFCSAQPELKIFVRGQCKSSWVSFFLPRKHIYLFIYDIADIRDDDR